MPEVMGIKSRKKEANDEKRTQHQGRSRSQNQNRDGQNEQTNRVSENLPSPDHELLREKCGRRKKHHMSCAGLKQWPLEAVDAEANAVELPLLAAEPERKKRFDSVDGSHCRHAE